MAEPDIPEDWESLPTSEKRALARRISGEDVVNWRAVRRVITEEIARRASR